MLKQTKLVKGQKGFTLIELLVVAAIIGILLALAIPNLLKARISANEANAKKMMQVLRDAEGEYFEMDLNDSGGRDYTPLIGADVGAAADTLRDPPGTGFPEDALVDSSFSRADIGGGLTVSDGSGDGDDCVGFGTAGVAKNGYCITNEMVTFCTANSCDDIGFKASYTSYNKVGRRDYAVYGDGSIRCVIGGLGPLGTTGTAPAAGTVGDFTNVDRTSPGCQ